MLRYTDVAWMDDHTAPSVHVRHNLEGLSTVFPPAYLLSFVTDHITEPLHEALASFERAATVISEAPDAASTATLKAILDV